MLNDTIGLPPHASRWQRNQAFPDATRRTNENKLQTFLLSQLKRLVAIGFPNHLSMLNHEFLGYVMPLKDGLKHVDPLSPWDLPLLVVIPEVLVPIHVQFRLIKLNEVKGKHARCEMEVVDSIVDSVETPRKPYLIFDVAFGTKPACPIKEQKRGHFIGVRRELTLIETIALAIHRPKLLLRNRLVARATYLSHCSANHPALYLYDGLGTFRKPILHLIEHPYRDFELDQTVVPSCRAGSFAGNRPTQGGLIADEFLMAKL